MTDQAQRILAVASPDNATVAAFIEEYDGTYGGMIRPSRLWSECADPIPLGLRLSHCSHLLAMSAVPRTICSILASIQKALKLSTRIDR